MSPTTAPYGSWPSPITAASLTAGAVSLSSIGTDGDDIFWLEGRATEGGRVVLVRRRADGSTADVTPPPFNVRSRVHEYGGGAYAVRDRLVVFSNFADGRLYRIDLADGSGAPAPITADRGGSVLRFGDLRIHPAGKWLAAVREDHRDGGEAVNTLVRIDLEAIDQEGEILVAGHDFVAGPRFSADGRRLAFLTWEHPDMPWDATVLWTAGVVEGAGLQDVQPVAGADRRESLAEPSWLDDGRLMISSDRSDWWNLYLVEVDGLRALHPLAAEFTGPAWTLGADQRAQTASGRIACRWRGPEHAGIGLLDPDSGELQTLDVPGRAFGSLHALGDDIVCLAGYVDAPDSVVRISGTTVRTLRRAVDSLPDPAYLSRPESVSWPTPDGATAYGYLYRPTNPDRTGPDGALPPLLTLSHGGPTGSASPSLNLSVQFWTSRGFAVLDVDYGGSTGYGRRYRQRLAGAWGVVDVDDCCSGAAHLADRGIVDPARMAIRGGSAGGYTTLAALVFRDVFTAGASYYGVADAELLARDTHKFESRYLDGLIGPYPAAVDTYRERSPIHHLDRLNCPVILLQGADDKVVPPNQAYDMADALRSKGLPVALIVFDGEGHGFRRAENIIRAQEAELSFYGQVFGFTPADEVEPVPIENLSS